MKGITTVVLAAFVLATAASAQQNPYVTPYTTPYVYRPPTSLIVDPNGCPKYCGNPQPQVSSQGSFTTFSQEPDQAMHKVGR
ncbi:hypothetical protein [Methylocystis parvus]|uniref:hypothetical protein n=1 Tax=Methylocystis parvus TaxID=134 RepID=UPI003C716BAE